MIKIMFVCSGNTCRSPMAQYYMQKRVNELNLQNLFCIDSCGVNAYYGQCASKNSIIAMMKYNVDLNNHKSKNISDTDILNYDYVFTLTNLQKTQILQIYKKLKDKIYTMKEFVYNNISETDINDPFGYNINEYNLCAEEIVKTVDNIVEKLKGCE